MVHSHSQAGSAANQSPRPAITTAGELRASGHTYLTVKDEIRHNLLARMRAGEDRFPGIIGFGQTVLPHLERALLAGHDTILLGERGQGKTRLSRPGSVLIRRVLPWPRSMSGLPRWPDARSTTTRSRRPVPAAAGWRPSRARTWRWPGGTAASAMGRSWRPPTPASGT